MKPTTRLQSSLSWALIATLTLQPFASAIAAGVKVAGSNTSLDKAGNGVPVVNIAPPNKAGISHNTYQQFNVGKEGLILNNATGQLTQTQLGGLIQNNPNLKGKAASGIINEVVSPNRSQLQGYVEVAGQAANVMVANPYGITCSGCGFINTPNATLTTGKPQFDANGNLSGLAVRSGDILVDGQGLDASRSDYFSLISRTAQINAGVHAKDLKVIAGANQVNADGRVTALDDSASSPQIAIDTGALGGMYASRIALVASDKGVGVNLGNLVTDQGDITLSADGKLVLGNASAGGNLNVQATTIELHGEQQTGSDMALNAEQNIALNGGATVTGGKMLASARGTLAQSADHQLKATSLQANADTLSLEGATRADNAVLTAGTLTLSNRAQAETSGDLILNAEEIDQQGKLTAKGSLTSRGKVFSNSGTLTAASLDVESDSLLNQGIISVAGETQLKSGQITNNGSLQTQRAATLLGHTLTNSGSLRSDGDIMLQFDRDFIQTSSGQTVAAGALELQADTLNTAGTLQGDTLTLGGGSWENSGQIAAADGGSINLGRSLNNNGTLQATRWQINAGSLFNQGTISGLQQLELNTSSELVNAASGRLQSSNEMAVDATTLENQGIIRAAGSASLTGDLLNNQGALAANSLRINTATLNNSGTLLSATLADIHSDHFQQQNGASLLSDGELRLSTAELDNDGTLQGNQFTGSGSNWRQHGTLTGLSALSLTLDSLNNSGDLQTQSSGLLQLGSLNNSGQMLAGSWQLNGDQADNSGTIIASQDLTFSLNQRLNNQTTGQLQATRIALHAPVLENSGSLSGRDITLDALPLTQGLMRVLASNTSRLTNRGTIKANALSVGQQQLTNSGVLQGTQSLSLQSSDAIDNQSAGQILTDGDLTLNGTSLTNEGWLQANHITLNGGTLNQQGTLFALTDMLLNVQQLTQGENGKTWSAGSLTIDSQRSELGGQVVAAGDATVNLQGDVLLSGTFAAAKKLALSVSGLLQQQGTLQGSSISLNSGSLDNSGNISAGADGLTIKSGAIAQQASGAIRSSASLLIASQSALNNLGMVGALGQLTLQAASALDNNGLIYSGADARLYASTINNNRGDIIAEKNLWLQRDAAGNSNTEVVNTSGTIRSEDGDITIKTGHLLNQRDGLTFTSVTTDLSGQYPWLGNAYAQIPLNKLPTGSWTINITTTSEEKGGGCAGADGACSIVTTSHYNPVMYSDYATLEFAASRTDNRVSSSGDAGKIAAGNNLSIQATALDNLASDISAAGNITLSGGTLNNQSYQAGVSSDIYTYYSTPLQTTSASFRPESIKGQKDRNYITFQLVDRHSQTDVSGGLYSSISAGGTINASFSSDISNTTLRSRDGYNFPQHTAPDLATGAVRVPSAQANGQYLDTQVPLPENFDLQFADDETAKQLVNYPLPTSLNGLFVFSNDSDSRYLITLNPNLSTMGQLDDSLFDQLRVLQGLTPQTTPRVETAGMWTDPTQFLGSDYLLGRLNIDPSNDYRFLGDAAFDTRYISNAVLSQTGQRYINGLGSDLSQMQYLMDNAAKAQQSLDLTLGVSLTAEQIAGLDHSIVWWENVTINGETVLAPHLYLAQADSQNLQGSSIVGSDVELQSGGTLVNNGTVQAQGDLTLGAQVLANQGKLAAAGDLSANADSISNQHQASITAGNTLQLSALNDIVNVGSLIQGQDVSITSSNGSVINQTETAQLQASSSFEKRFSSGTSAFTHTYSDTTGSIMADGDLSVSAGKTISNLAGSLQAGSDLTLKAGEDVVFGANQLTESSSELLKLYGSSYNNSNRLVSWQASQVNAGSALKVTAGHDVTINSSTLVAGGDLSLTAGNDMQLLSALNHEDSISKTWQKSASTSRSSVASSQLVSGGSLTLNAGRDLTSTAAIIGATDRVSLSAGRDLILASEQTSNASSRIKGNDKYIRESIRQQGTTLSSGDELSVQAGRDITATATQARAEGDLALLAGRNITLTSSTESDYSYDEKKRTSGGMFSKKTTHTITETRTTQQKGSELSGSNVTLQAANNLLVKGSAVVGDGQVLLKAGNDLDIAAATDTSYSWNFKETTKSGLLSSGGIGFTIGSQKEKVIADNTRSLTKSSMVGSLGGNTLLLAGNNYSQMGSSVSSPAGSVLVQGKNVTIQASSDPYSSNYQRTFEQKGLTVAVNVPAIQAVQGAIAAIQKVGQSKDGRVNALATANAIWDANDAAGDLLSTANNMMANGAQGAAQNVSVSITYGQQKQTSSQKVKGNDSTGSKLIAGTNAVIVATGGEHSDINIIGSEVAGNQLTLLKADDNVNIVAASNQRDEKSSNKSIGWNAGVAISYGQGGAAFGITAGGNYGKGNGNGEEQTWLNSHVGYLQGQTVVDSGETLSLNGGQIIGKGVSISADNLNITSVQDTMSYSGKQMNISGQVTVGYGFAASGSFSQSKLNASYASVQQQSGILAGDNGYQVDITNHTALNGGLVTSTALAEQAGKNSFSTGTLTAHDIDNHSEYKGSAFGFGGSVSYSNSQQSSEKSDEQGKTSGGKTAQNGSEQLQKSGSFGIGYDSESERSVTRSGISTANVTITRPNEQLAVSGKTLQQTLEGIKTTVTTDTAAASAGRLTNDFDKDAVFKELNLQVSVTKEFKQNAQAKIGEYLDARQANAALALKEAIASGYTVKRDEALAEVYKLEYQRKFLETLVGIVAGSPDVAITQGTLELAATRMRQETAENSFLFAGITDGNMFLSNFSGESSAMFDGLKLGGSRLSLDILCGVDNGRCAAKDAQGNAIKVSDGKYQLAQDDSGKVIFTGDATYHSLSALLLNKGYTAGLYGATGGSQAMGGLMFGGDYSPGSFLDTVVESYAGPHDLIGGELPGFYDALGNTTRDRSTLTSIGAEASTDTAIPLATPLALSEMVSPDILQFIFSAVR